MPKLRNSPPLWLCLANPDWVFMERRPGDDGVTSRLRAVPPWRAAGLRRHVLQAGHEILEIDHDPRVVGIRIPLRVVVLAAAARVRARPTRGAVARARRDLWEATRDMLDLRAAPLIGSTGLEWLRTRAIRGGRVPFALFPPRGDLDEVGWWLAGTVAQYYVDSLFLSWVPKERSRLRLCEHESCGRIFVATHLGQRGRRLTDSFHPTEPDHVTDPRVECRFCSVRCRRAAHRVSREKNSR